MICYDLIRNGKVKYQLQEVQSIEQAIGFYISNKDLKIGDEVHKVEYHPQAQKRILEVVSYE